jgi:hypothetical protein
VIFMATLPLPKPGIDQVKDLSSLAKSPMHTLSATLAYYGWRVADRANQYAAVDLLAEQFSIGAGSASRTCSQRGRRQRTPAADAASTPDATSSRYCISAILFRESRSVSGATGDT